MLRQKMVVQTWRCAVLQARQPLVCQCPTTFHLSRTFHKSQILENNPQRRPGFFSQVIDNIKQEMSKNKDMKDNIKKFREEAEKLEQSEALQKARQKFQTVESEASKGSEVFKERLDTIKDKMGEVMEEAGKTDIAKKAGQFTEGIGKSARGAAESISATGHKIGKTQAYQTFTQTATAVKKELDQSSMQAYMYKRPAQLRKRKEFSHEHDARVVEPNEDATGMELHKDSKFFQSWQNFKDNNQYVNKMVDWKMKYDESENPVIRASRLLTDKVTDIMGGLFQKTELSETLTEICKADPNFDKNEFLVQCETDIIPNVLEAMVQGDLEILKDWCHEAPYNVLATPIKQARTLNLHFHSKVIDIDNVDLALGKMMDQGPVLIITFTAQQIMCLKDSSGKVLEGDPDKIMRVNYVWVLCRDQTELDPRAAWRLLELAATNMQEQFV